MITVKVRKKEIKDIELSMPFIVCQINRKTREISLLSPADVEECEKQDKDMIQRFRDKINAYIIWYCSRHNAKDITKEEIEKLLCLI